MTARAGLVSREQWLWFCIAALVFLLGQSSAFAQPSCCGGSGCCGPHGQACTLEYGASGVVRDSVTGAPIAGAFVGVLNVATESGADGTFAVTGARPDTCNLDYYYSLISYAAGYEEFATSLYTSAMFQTFDIMLNPVGTSDRFTVSGTVAEFPPCNGRMRGVGVILEPGGWSTQTSVDANDGGRFAFYGVLPGVYTVRVVPGCNPYGCWNPEPLQVEAGDVDVSLCMSPIDPNATPTPTPTVYPGPSRTVTVCPVKTPCIIGEQPLHCAERCDLGCGCEPCPECPEGKVSAPRLNVCECVPDPNVTPGPTSTPGNCFFPTPPLCPVGQTAQCLTEDGCDSHCSCVACDPCAPGLSYSGEPNSCVCLDPRTITATPTPDTRTATPTPDICALPTPPLCPVGQTPHCVQTDCLIGCSCEPCNDCPEGLVFSGEPNRCECVDPRTPSQRPTATPSPSSGETPRVCPSSTPVLCPTGEAVVCDTAIDPCGLCECRAVPQQPGGEDASLSPDSNGGCGIVAPRDAKGTLWSWSLLFAAAVSWQRSRRRRA